MIKKLLNTKISKENKKGFTLAELLIVVAIIGVLVAISIPIFTTQLEKSREATDAANIRSAYAEVMAEAITDGTKDITRTVTLKQAQDGWQGDEPDIAGDGTISGTGHVNPTVTGTPSKGGSCEVKYTAPSGDTAGTVTINFGAGA